MKSIRDIIKANIIDETNQSVDIDDTNFFVELANSKSKDGNSKIFNFSILIFAIIIGLAFVINSSVYFVKDVLCSKNDCKITSEGAIAAYMNGDKEFYLYMFNASEPWTNTGIQLLKGDKMRMRVSGGFFSDALGLYEAAQWNFKPYYEWISMSNNDATNHKFVWPFVNNKEYINNKKDSRLICEETEFGDLIYRIGNEEDSDDKIHYLNKSRSNFRYYFDEVQESGYLLLSINEVKQDATLGSRPQNYDSIMFSFKEKNTKYYNYHEEMIGDKKAFGEFIHSAWSINDNYKDNIGQILVAVEIQRKLDNVQWRKIWYRYVENNVVGIWSSNIKGVWKTLLTVVFMIWAIFYAVYRIVALLFAVWYLTVPCLLVLSWYFRDAIIQVFKKIIQAIKRKK